ncbi:hypothetical protein [Halovivax limisalsi]|uniref:hypothetical protein n=1 Tax=Halovivax limisalsi TaxID=1453760 RepID=UPI001FFDE7EF|nr:hypothetical protein [Halovivax limisalsi]
MTEQALQTEFEFTLPRGYVDDDGTMHSEGRMRLATAADEIQPLQDPQVQSNQSYLTITLLARVVTDLGTLETVDRSVIENLFVADLEYLQAMYERINNTGRNTIGTGCPECGTAFEVEVTTGRPLLDSDVDETTAMEDGSSAEMDGAFVSAGEQTDDADVTEETDAAAGDAPTGNPTE